MFQCCNCTQSRVSLLIVHGVSLPLRDMCLFLRYYDINLPLITQGMSYITRND
jgi:hypothetical protein